jgi:hypothetical protein
MAGSTSSEPTSASAGFVFELQPGVEQVQLAQVLVSDIELALAEDMHGSR